MNNTSLYTYIETELAWQLDDHFDMNIGRVAEDLADKLKANGYCSDPYTGYEQALCCPINKRREKECLMVSCPNNEFCRMLRKEGYII